MKPMIEAATASDADTDAAQTPRLRGKKRARTMRTPGMGAMMGAPRPGKTPGVMGKIEPGATPYKKGGSIDGCAVRGKTKGKIL